MLINEVQMPREYFKKICEDFDHNTTKLKYLLDTSWKDDDDLSNILEFKYFTK